MSMTVSAAYVSQLTATITPGATPSLDSADNTFKQSGLNTSLSALNASSTPPVTAVATFRATLVSGALAIDLTALTDNVQGLMSLSGLKIVAIKFKMPPTATFANAITVTTAASNFYAFLGASGSVVLLPSWELLLYCFSTNIAVDGTHKIITLAGTGSQYVDIEIYAG